MSHPPLDDPRLDRLRVLVDPRLAKLREARSAMPSVASDATAHPVARPEQIPTLHSAPPTPAQLPVQPVPQEHLSPLGQELTNLAAPAVGVVEGIQQQAVNLAGRPILRVIGKPELDHPTLQEQHPDVGTGQAVGRHVGNFVGGALPYMATDGLLGAAPAVSGAIGGAVSGGLDAYGRGEDAKQVAESAAKSGLVAGALGAATKLPGLVRGAVKDIRAASDALPVHEPVPLLPEGSGDKLAKLRAILAGPNLANERGALGEPHDSYAGQHRAPTDGAPLYDLTGEGVYPADVYGPNGHRYYGVGDGSDRHAYDLAMEAQSQPNKPVRVYRAIPKDVPGRSVINDGDWVTLDRQYAKDHGESALNGEYRIVSKQVYARDLVTDGNSLQEWGYHPRPRLSDAEVDAVRVQHGKLPLKEARALKYGPNLASEGGALGSTGSLDRDALTRIADEIKGRHGLSHLHISVRHDGVLSLDMIEVPRAARGQGAGSAAVKEVADLADQHGMTLTLTPALKDDIHGTTSRSRLVRFYKRLGFVENTGRNKDFALPSGSMYRLPSGREGVGGTQMLTTISGAGVGAAGGAATDKEHPVRGAILGGLAGAAVGAGLGTAASKLGRRGGVALEPEPVMATPEELTGYGKRRLPPTEPPPAPTGPPVDPEDYAKIATFALDPSGADALRKEVARIGPEAIGDPKRVISHAQTRRLAESIGIDDLRETDVNTRLSGPEMLAIRNLVNRNTTMLRKAYESLKSTPSPETDQLIGALEAQNESLLARFITNRARTGRDLNNMAILAKQSMDPFIWLTKAKNLAEQGGRKLTGEQAAEIQRLAEAEDRPGLLQYMSKLAPVTNGQKALTVWKAGLLTSPTTSLANIGGNAAMAGLEATKDAPAALVDRLLSHVTGQRTTGFSPALMARASMDGAKAGVREAKLTLKGIPTGQGLAKGEIPHEVHFNNPILDAYTKGVFRTLEAQDRVFYQLAIKRSLANQASALAKQTGKTAAELYAAPTDAMAMQAARDAEYATFKETTSLTRGVMHARKAFGTAGEIVMPFAKTPTNIATTVLDYTPLGGLRSAASVVRLFKAVAKDASPAEVAELQRAAAQQAGRATTGAIPILVGYKLAERGLATGANKPDKTGRDEQSLEGGQPNAVLLGGKWRAITRLSPLGNLVALGANLYEITHNTQLSAVDKVAATGASVGTTVTESPFFQGVDQVIAGVKDPVNQGGRYVSGLATSVVPSVVKRVARGIDPTVREAHGLGDQMANAIPGLSQTLPAKVDQLGQTVSRDQGLAGALFDPLSSRTDRRSDPVVKALSATGAQIPALKRQPDESERTFALRSRVDGSRLRQALVAILASPKYRTATPDEQAALLEYTARRTRSALTRSRQTARP